MSEISSAGREPALDGGQKGSDHMLATSGNDNNDASAGLDADFAQSCVLEDPRGKINLTYSQLISASNDSLDDSQAQTANEFRIGSPGKLVSAKSDSDFTTLSRMSSSGFSYATVTAMSEEVPQVNNEAVVVEREEQLMIKVAIGPQHFDLLKLIGEGAFGKVLMVKNLLDLKIYAMKIISKKLLKKKNSISYMKSERDILTKIDHPFIVSLFFAFQTEKKIFLVN